MAPNYESTIKLIIAEGKALLKVSGKIEDIGEKKKWLTEKDFEIEKKLTELVCSYNGEHAVYAEEINYNYKTSENVWIIDPISHTYSFLHGLPHYSLVISHLYKGNIIFAAMYDPTVDELFTAIYRGGAYLNGKQIHVNSIHDRCILYDPYSSVDLYGKESNLLLLEDLFGLGRVKAFGSLGLHYAYVACGRVQGAVTKNCDVFPEFAGKLLVEEAGGVFSDFNGNELGINTLGIIASCDEEMHKEILGVVAKHPCITGIGGMIK